MGLDTALFFWDFELAGRLAVVAVAVAVFSLSAADGALRLLPALGAAVAAAAGRGRDWWLVALPSSLQMQEGRRKECGHTEASTKEKFC